MTGQSKPLELACYEVTSPIHAMTSNKEGVLCVECGVIVALRTANDHFTRDKHLANVNIPARKQEHRDLAALIEQAEKIQEGK